MPDADTLARIDAQLNRLDLILADFRALASSDRAGVTAEIGNAWNATHIARDALQRRRDQGESNTD